jgi:hypothetical protein
MSLPALGRAGDTPFLHQDHQEASQKGGLQPSPRVQETNQYTSARPRARNTHGQDQGPLPHWSWGRQAMTDDIFGGSSPKGNVVWVPTALPALATTLLELSMVLIPIRKLFTL